MDVSIACDHKGINLAKQIVDYYQNIHNVFSYLPYGETKVDYPDYAEKVAKDIQSKKSALGILICGSGVGMCIAANKFKTIRAAVIHDIAEAELAKKHNNINMVCLSSEKITLNESISLIDKVISTKFEGDRHITRLEKISKIEQSQ